MKKIILIFRAPVGGLFRHVYDLSKELSFCGYEVGIICDNSRIAPKWQAMIDELKCVCKYGVLQTAIHRGPHILDLHTAFIIWKYLNTVDPDIVHGHGAKGGLFARLSGSFVKSKPARLYTAHGGSLQFATRAYEGKIYHSVEKYLYSHTDGIICESDYIRRMFVEKIDKIPVLHRVIFNGLNESEFESRNLSDKPYDFLFFAEFTLRKGYDIFINSLAKVKQNFPNCSALCVGSGHDEQKFKNMVVKAGLEGNVKFSLPMPAREVFSISRMLVIPSRAESMPYAILEAAACGMPIISSDVGGIPEIFQEENALGLVENDNLLQFEQHMCNFLVSPDKFHDAAMRRREFIKKNFDIKFMIKETIRIYNDALVVRRG